MKTGIELFAQERQRQIEKEGHSPDRDRLYTRKELVLAAKCYAKPEEGKVYRKDGAPRGWPWDVKFWKPTPDNRVRELVKAGALYMAENARRGDDCWGEEIKRLAAEIDRLQATEEAKP